MKAIIYTVMSIFDFGIVAGCAYLIDQRGWSAWWMILAVVIICGSNPTNILKLTPPGEIKQ